MINTLQISTKIRTLCCSTSNIINMLGPLLAYQLTSSLSAAGFILIIATIAKVLSYLYGSSLSSLFSPRKIHITGETLRLISVALFIPIAMKWIPWQFLAISATLNYISIASTNLLYETNNERWGKDVPNAHAYQTKSDLNSAIIATVLAFIVKEPIWLTAIASILQTYGIWQICQSQQQLYPNNEIDVARSYSMKEWKAPLMYLSQFNRSIWACTALSMATTFSNAMLLSQIPFFLDHAFSTKISVQHVAIFNGVKLILAGGLMNKYLQFVKQHQGADAKIAILAMSVILILLTAMITITGYAFAVALLAYCIIMYFVGPFTKKLRQHFSKKSAGITGVMSALETATFVGAGMLFSTGLSIESLLIATAVGTIMLTAICVWLFIPEKQTIINAINGDIKATSVNVYSLNT